MKIIYEDEDIIVIRKPAGVATQSANIASKDCVSMLKEYLKTKTAAGKEPYVGVVHRLDQPVAGILVFAKNEKAAANLSKQVQSDIMSKKYHAIVEGVCEKADRCELVNDLYKDSKDNKAVILKPEQKKANVKVQKAILYYSTEDISKDNALEMFDSEGKQISSLVSIELQTGRFHQIRAQLSNIGHPIAGDKKYGSTIKCPSEFADREGARRGAIALLADSLDFKHPVTNEMMHFEI